ncbi:MAG: hypothetical protein ACPGQS_08355 [Bradymonadia bacterium]
MNKQCYLASPMVALFASLLSLGCSKPSVDPPIKPEPPAFAAPKTPRLLPKVDLKSALPALKNDDGTGRIDGHMVRLKGFLEKTITVTGTVVYKSSTKWKNKRRTLPHLYIADENNADTDLKLLVVKLDEKMMRKIKEGKRYTFTGKFVQKHNALGWENERGMLVLDTFEAVKN